MSLSPNMLIAALFSLTLCCSAWVDTTNGTHLFLTFDAHVTKAQLASLPPTQPYTFVWGVSSTHIPWYTAYPNTADIQLSRYIPFARSFSGHNLSWFQEYEPSWVVYKCDRKTPAYEFHDPNIPLDISNPAVLAWQIAEAAVPAAMDKLNVMALDNVALVNAPRGCGVWRNGTWVQLYDGEHDPQYAIDVVNWMKRFAAACHELGLKTTINFSLGPSDHYNDPHVMALSNGTDSVLSERGFTNYGSHLIVGPDWENIIEWMLNLQRYGKAFFSVNEWGGAMTPHTETWIFASYLMGKNNLASVYSSTVQGYGSLVNNSLLTHSGPTGVALSDRPQIDSDGVYYRHYTQCVAVVNPTPKNTTLSNLKNGVVYRDFWGNGFKNGDTLPAESGLVLWLL